MVLQAQASGAQVIGLASVGDDLVNLVKQAGEFGIQNGRRQTLAGFLIYITEVHALGLESPKVSPSHRAFTGTRMTFRALGPSTFWLRRRPCRPGSKPGVYTASLHFLKGMQKAGTATRSR